MPLVSDTIPSLINGVSQEPGPIRLPSQVGEQVNGFSSEIDGLGKRAPMQHIAKIDTAADTGAYVHAINRDLSNRWIVVMTNGDLKVYGIDGSPKTVNFPLGKSYLDTLTPGTSLRATTVADYTFIVNREVTVQMNPYAQVPWTAPWALILVKQGNYGKKYYVNITAASGANIFAWFQTPDGSSASDSVQVGTDFIANKLINIFNSAAGGTGLPLIADGGSCTLTYVGGTLTQLGSILSYVGPDDDLTYPTGDEYPHYAVDFQVSTSDGFGGNAMTVIKDSVQSFSQLPNTAPDGFPIAISGSDASSFTNYYVKFQKFGTDDTVPGVWKEVARPMIHYELDASTMPWVLISNADGTFTFTQGAWENRTVGDYESAPDPSFVGSAINDVFLYRNRLGILSGENFLLSQEGHLYNFWPTTVTTTLDDAAIDAATTTDEVAFLNSAAPFAKRLLMFSDELQTSINVAGTIITPRTLVADVEAHYENKSTVRPVGTGKSLFFIQETSSSLWARLREMLVSPDGVTLEANDITQHSPAYIPAGVFKITASSSANMCAILSSGAPNSLYIYKWYYSDSGDKQQSCISRWDLPAGCTLIGAEFIGTNLYVIYTTSEGTFLGVLMLDVQVTDPSSPYTIYLDRRCAESQVSMTYDGTNTTITLPYAPSAAATAVARATDSILVGDVATVVSTSGDTMVVAGDWSSRKFYVGEPYQFYVALSPMYMRRYLMGGNSKVLLDGRLQIRSMELAYSNTGHFTASVTGNPNTPAALTRSKEFVGSKLGTYIPGHLPISPVGTFRFPVEGRNTNVLVEISDSSHLPLKFQSLVWVGFYNAQAQAL